MDDNKEIILSQNNALMDIFIEEEDKRGTDILAMSDFFSVFIGKIETELETDTDWEVCHSIDGFIGEIASAIKSGVDISKKGMLVADYSHFNQDIVNGLKSGIYHVGQSKEVAGNLRPAILDENEHLVKFFTLKKASNPSNILSDISTLSMQTSLKQISSQIEDVGRVVKSTNDFVRREDLSNRFINAREKIMLAATSDADEQEQYLKEADTYLMEGLNALKSDVDAQVKELGERNKPFESLKSIDNILSYINEDMLMIPRYVGLRAYLLNYRNRFDDANRVLEDYRYQLQSLLSDKKYVKGKYTALELIHKNYPYEVTNVDFWLEQPKQMINAIDSYEKALEQKGNDIFYIGTEDYENE